MPDRPGGPTPPAAHHDLEDVIDHIIACAARNEAARNSQGRVSVADLMDAIGERSFGPLLLVPSLIALSPIGAIPFLPFFTSAVVVLIAAQILLHHEHFWIPRWLACRSMDAQKLEHGLEKLRPVVRMVDHVLLPRLPWLTSGLFFYLIALACLLIGLVTPILEIIPLVGGIPPNAALVAFSLAITARDGLWALLAFGFMGASVALLAAPLWH